MNLLAEGQRWTVIHGDCLEVLPTLADKSVAHVITDPPYSAHVHSKQRRILNNGVVARGVREVSLGFAHIGTVDRAAVGAHLARVAARWLLVFSDAETAHERRGPIADAGAPHVRVGAWVKNNPMPQLTGDRPAPGIEAIQISHSSGCRKRWNGGGRPARWISNVLNSQDGERNGHTTQKPLPLMLELVGLFTDPEDIVLDPFCGSGTTGVACLRLGRRFIGIEKDERYAAIARERLEAESRGLTLRDARHGQTSIFDALGAK
jgi:site-specific DNA-methyltransferase (adenine-specific)